MADEGISNNVIAALLVVAIVLSIGGFYMIMAKPVGITGAWSTSQNGTVSANATATLSIMLTDASINLGNIATNATRSSSDASDYFVLENDGNTVADIQVNATNPFSSATKCPSLPCAGFYSVSAGATNANCANNSNMAGASSGLLLDNLNYVDGSDTSSIGVSVTIPGDEPPGVKSSTVTLWALGSSTATGCT